MSDFNGELNKSLDDFMESYKIIDEEYIYSNGTEFVPIFRVKQWFEYNNQDKEIERLNNIINDIDRYIHLWNIDEIGEKTMLILNDILLIKNDMAKEVDRLKDSDEE